MNLEEKAVWVLHRLSDSANDKELLNLLLADASSLPEDIEVKAVADWLEQKGLIDRWDISVGRVLVKITPVGRDYLESLRFSSFSRSDLSQSPAACNNISDNQHQVGSETGSSRNDNKEFMLQKKEYRMAAIGVAVTVLLFLIELLISRC